MQHNSFFVHKKSVRYISATNDSLLLIAGLSMALISKQYPFVEPWLTTKIAVLLAYIVFGSFALKYGSSLRIRNFNGVIAILCFIYIVSVAYSRTPYPWVIYLN
jgi:uncharacterized membrane protein SirB2